MRSSSRFPLDSDARRLSVTIAHDFNEGIHKVNSDVFTEHDVSLNGIRLTFMTEFPPDNRQC
jgi:hypothetical protein